MPSSLSRRRFLATTAALASASCSSRHLFAQATTQAAGGLLVRTKEPFNAEPALSALVAQSVTPVDQFYVRNHGPLPKLSAEQKLTVEGLARKPLTLSLAEIQQRFPQRSVSATLTCAGNRRQEMNAQKPTGGVQWDAGAIGHARWTGALLADLLRSAELQPDAKHIWFEGLDPITEKDGSVAPFGGSIPLEKALAADSAALVAHAMNGQPLTPEHGSPLRTIVPGYIGARSVKWLGKIVVSDRPSPNHYLADAYKLVQSDDKTEVRAAAPIYTFPINAAICQPAAGAKLPAGRVTIQGYALPSGDPGCYIQAVELSRDGGQTWQNAKLRVGVDSFSWTLWSLDVDLPPGSHQLVVRAYDSLGHTMPERCAWNFKGYLYNAWHRVNVQVG